VVPLFLLAAVSAVLDPSPALSGNCNPTRVHFTGRITTDGPARVTYTWVRPNHPAGHTLTVDFDKAGTVPVTYDVMVRKAESGNVTLRVILPVQSDSAKVTYKVSCK
jgi:hypothetical protein